MFVVWKWTLTDYVNSVAVIKPSSLFERDSRVLSCQQCCSKLFCKLSGAVQPWPHNQGYRIWRPGSSQPSRVWIRASPLLCCVGPLISTPNWAPSLGTLVPPSDQGVFPGGLYPLNMLRLPDANVSSLPEMDRLSPPFLAGLVFLCSWVAGVPTGGPKVLIWALTTNNKVAFSSFPW